MTILRVGDYTPDAADYLNSGMTIANNVYPRSDGSDGPLGAAIIVSDPMPDEPVGYYVTRDGDGVVYTIAGTQTDLYLLTAMAWGSKSGAAYNATTIDPWRFTRFGDLILACEFNSPVQSWQLASGGNFANLAAAAPQARYIATIEPGFVMLANLFDAALRPNVVRWSAINDATSWPTIGSTAAAAAQSDEQELPGGLPITGLVGAVGGAAGLVFTSANIYRVEYIGAPAIFAFREIERASGNICPDGVAVVNGAAYYISATGFERFDGQQETHIGFGRVDKTFFADVNASFLYRVRATVDPQRALVIWAYPSNNSTDGTPDRWIMFNYASNRWRTADDAAIAALTIGTYLTTGYTLDTLDTILPLGIDAYDPMSVDTATYTGTLRLMSGFNASWELVTYNGTSLAARLETGETDGEGRRLFVRGMRLLSDASGATASVGYRDSFNAAVNYTTGTLTEATGLCPARIETRYARARVDIPAGDSWSYFQGVDVAARPASGR